MPIPTFTDGVFQIDSQYGFLPKEDPIAVLPDRYQAIQSILDRLPEYTKNTDHDHLYPAIQNLSNLIKFVKGESDRRLLVALFRSYCFLSSAYLLYPSYSVYAYKGEYGQGADRLPVQLAQPLMYLASKLLVYPWLEYSYAYSLCNYVRKDPTRGLDYDNLKMATSFSGTADENGFIMVHVDINQHTPVLIRECSAIYDIWESPEANIKAHLQAVIEVLKKMNVSRKRMWEASRWQHYNDFRIYIMGIAGNTHIFPRGVRYEPEKKPRYYRGQSGSQDSIIPFLDSFFRVCDFYPANELTEYLRDMRQYRPKPFRDLIEWTETHTTGLAKWIIETGHAAELLEIYRQIYDFRNGHWQFVQKYIMANTKYPKATGGTPIISWLPNQIEAILDAMKWVMNTGNIRYEPYAELTQLLDQQKSVMRAPDYKADDVYNLNEKYHQRDSIL